MTCTQAHCAAKVSGCCIRARIDEPILREPLHRAEMRETWAVGEVVLGKARCFAFRSLPFPDQDYFKSSSGMAKTELPHSKPEETDELFNTPSEETFFVHPLVLSFCGHTLCIVTDICELFQAPCTSKERRKLSFSYQHEDQYIRKQSAQGSHWSPESSA